MVRPIQDFGTGVDTKDLEREIDAAWDKRETLSPATKGKERDAVHAALELLDSGRARVAEKSGGTWQVRQWLKKAVLLSFRLNGMTTMGGEAYDKVPLKFSGWGESEFREAQIRVVPGAIVRKPAFIGRGAVLMPCFVNAGASIGENTMIDTWATVGSCAQVGRNCHISGGTGIGGVLEPVQARPVIIEDNCFIGARSEVAEGVMVGEGAVIAMGVTLGASTKIVERASGKIHQGMVPPYSVVVPGALPQGNAPALYCAVIVKTVDAQTRAKTAINELLRD